MSTCVGYVWRYLEQRAKENASKSLPKREHSFIVESDDDDNDGESLLGFMKNVEPHQELIPPPSYIGDHRQLQIRRNQNAGRLNAGATSSDPQNASKQKQNNDVAMTANAFSDLDAIAEMGASADDPDSQSQISGQNTPCLPVYSGDCSHTMSSQQVQPGMGQTSKDFVEQKLNRINQISGMQQQNSLLQLSPLEQQRMSAYRQQHQKILAGVSSYRMMQQGQYVIPPQSGPEVFDFDDSSNFVGPISSPSYQSPSGRCRGRGRRGGGNVGDRQLSFSSLENESTPGSPSDFPGKKRGVSGQRKPRKSRTREIALASDEKLSFPYQQPPLSFQASQYQRQQPIPQQQVSTPGHLNYNIPSNEEFHHSRLIQEYYESSDDDDQEMDPPPPPVNLQRESTEKEKVSEIQRGEKAKISSKHSGSIEPQLDESSQQKISGDFSDFTKQQIQPSSNDKIQKQQRLVNSRLTSASSSTSASVASSPPQRQGEQIMHKMSGELSSKDSRKNSKTSLKEIEEFNKQNIEIKQEIKLSHPIYYHSCPDAYDDVSTQNITIKKELPSELKDDDNKNKILTTKSNEIKSNKNLNKPQKIKNEGGETRKWSNTSTTTITEDNNNLSKKTGKIVLKIKPPKDGGGIINLQSKNNTNSSSSPSSSSSSSISTSINICQTFQQAIESQSSSSQPVARLSSSGAPPSKLKQQTLQQQQQNNKSIGIKRTAIDDIIENVKLKKGKKEGGGGKYSLSPPTQQQQQQSQRSSSISSNIKSIKEVKKNNNNVQQKDLTNSSVVKQTTFPNLKNFKIPKVVESEPTHHPPQPPPPSQQQQQIPSSKTEQQQTQKNFSGSEGRINKYLDTSIPSSSSYGGGGGDYNNNSRRYGEKKSSSNWDNKTSNYLPQHVRQQKNQKPSNGKHSYNDSNRNKKFSGGGPPNIHNQKRGGGPIPSSQSINRNQQQHYQQQQKYNNNNIFPSTQQREQISINQSCGFANQNWQSFNNSNNNNQTQNSAFSPQIDWSSSSNQQQIPPPPTNVVRPQLHQQQTNILRYEVNNNLQTPQIDDGLQIVDEE